MTNPLTVQLGELASSLAGLRRRFRQAARLEVARAVGEALQDFAQALICGSARWAEPPRPATGWDDPWQEPGLDPWRADAAWSEEASGPETAPAAARLQAALAVGLGAARWSFVRTRQLPLAVVIGLVVALAAYGGGPTIQAVLDAWTLANDLLNHPGPDRPR